MRFTRNYLPQLGNCFVVMPFGEKELRDGRSVNWDDHYKSVIEPAIKELKMTAIRADEIYGAKPLLDRLWQGIQEAEIVVAELTGRSPNVLYEVGLAHVIGKRILILTMYPDDVPVDLAEFVQIRYSAEGIGLVQFTRELKSNLEAARREASAEAMLTPLPSISGSGGIDPVPATVIHVTASFATVETKDGRRGFLSAEDYSWTKLPRDLTRDLRVDRELRGAFVSDLKGEPRYSLTALQENPWPRLEKEFPVDSIFRGVVASLVPGIGAFVEMKYRIRGLIPQFQLPRDVHQGCEVKAQVEKIDSALRRVSLRFIEVSREERTLNTREERPGNDGWGPFQRGQTFEGHIAVVKQDSGWALVQVDDRTKGILYADRMSSRLRDRFLGGELRQGEHVTVEVVSVNYDRQRLVLRDVDTEGSSGEPTDLSRGLAGLVSDTN